MCVYIHCQIYLPQQVNQWLWQTFLWRLQIVTKCYYIHDSHESEKSQGILIFFKVGELSWKYILIFFLKSCANLKFYHVFSFSNLFIPQYWTNQDILWSKALVFVCLSNNISFLNILCPFVLPHHCYLYQHNCKNIN